MYLSIFGRTVIYDLRKQIRKKNGQKLNKMSKSNKKVHYRQHNTASLFHC